MVKHLPLSIKHLLSLRNPHSWPSPPISKLNEVFKKTFRDAQLKKAETGWLVLTVGPHLHTTCKWLMKSRHAPCSRPTDLLLLAISITS